MKAICFYFQVHQPFRLKTYRFFDIGSDHQYFDKGGNTEIMQKVARKCYLPANRILYDLIMKHHGHFKVSFSISGTALDQFQQYAPEVLKSFQKLVSTGCVELLAETSSHSLAALGSEREFKMQVREHVQKIYSLFNVKPVVFRNTELIYNDRIAEMVAEMGFKGILTEGASHILGHRSPNHVYKFGLSPQLKILLRNYRLSDDIAFRFSDQSWSQWPLHAEKFVQWLNALSKEQEIVNLFMDYETFGEHQWATNGIFNFLADLPQEVFGTSSFIFTTPLEAFKKFRPIAPLRIPHPISWADEARDLSAWTGNDLQKDALKGLYKLKKKVWKCTDVKILQDWKYLQTSDHFYYMSTKNFADGDVHKYFNPYTSPYLAFINYMNVLSDFEIRVRKHLKKRPQNQGQQYLLENVAIDEGIDVLAAPKRIY